MFLVELGGHVPPPAPPPPPAPYAYVEEPAMFKPLLINSSVFVSLRDFQSKIHASKQSRCIYVNVYELDSRSFNVSARKSSLHLTSVINNTKILEKLMRSFDSVYRIYVLISYLMNVFNNLFYVQKCTFASKQINIRDTYAS